MDDLDSVTTLCKQSALSLLIGCTIHTVRRMLNLTGQASSVGDESKVPQAIKVGRAVAVAGLARGAVVVGVERQRAGGRARVVGDLCRGPAGCEPRHAAARVDIGRPELVCAAAVRVEGHDHVGLGSGYGQERHDHGKNIVEHVDKVSLVFS